MSIRRLRTLVAVAERGSFGDAAEAVSLSQAAVSLQMKSLEEDLQVTLFDRTKRPPVLNATGHALIPRAREALRAYDDLLRSVASETELSGELVMGAMPWTMTGTVPVVVSKLRNIYPHLRVHVVPAHAVQMLPQLERGQLDTGIVTQPPYVPDHLEYRPFADEPLMLLAPKDSPSLPARELLERYPFIRFDRNQWVGQLIDDWLRKEGIQVNELMELDTIESVSNMVYFNLGVTLVPQPCIPPPNPLPLRRVPLGPDAPNRVLGLLTRRDSPKSRLVDVLYEQLVSIVEAERIKAGTIQTAQKEAIKK